MVKQGDVIKVDFDPQKGHEQAGYRPAIVISNNIYNERTGLVLACPITNNTKSFPLHIELPSNMETSGAVLCEHVRALDINKRGYKVIEKSPAGFLKKVIHIIKAEIEII